MNMSDSTLTLAGSSEKIREEEGMVEKLSQDDLLTIIYALGQFIGDYKFYEKYPHLQEYQDLQDAKATLEKVIELYKHVEMEGA